MTDPTQLTDRQLDVLRTIYRLTAAHGRPPSDREVKRTMEAMSHYDLACHLHVLEKRGWIQPTTIGDASIRLKGLAVRPAFTADAAGERLRAAIKGEAAETAVEGVG